MKRLLILYFLVYRHHLTIYLPFLMFSDGCIPFGRGLTPLDAFPSHILRSPPSTCIFWCFLRYRVVFLISSYRIQSSVFLRSIYRPSTASLSDWTMRTLTTIKYSCIFLHILKYFDVFWWFFCWKRIRRIMNHAPWAGRKTDSCEL